MAIDVGAARGVSGQLHSCAGRLRGARETVSGYCSELYENWEGLEVGYYASALSGIENRLQAAAGELESLGDDIVSTAQEIWEEEEAERRRREEEERQRQEEEARQREAAQAYTSGGGGRSSSGGGNGAFGGGSGGNKNSNGGFFDSWSWIFADDGGGGSW